MRAFVESRLTLALSCHLHRQLLYTLEVGGWGKKKKLTYALECKITFGRILKPTIYNYTHMHIYCISCILLIICFLLYIRQCILVWLLKRGIKGRHSYPSLQNKCIIGEHRHSSEFSYIFLWFKISKNTNRISEYRGCSNSIPRAQIKRPTEKTSNNAQSLTTEKWNESMPSHSSSEKTEYVIPGRYRCLHKLWNFCEIVNS